MPPKGYAKPVPVDRRLKVGLSDADYAAIAAKAEANGVPVAAYVRSLITADLGHAGHVRSRSAPDRGTLALLAEVHQLAMHVKVIAMSVNQMARQVEHGHVPLTLPEIRVMQSQVAEAMGRAVSLFDRVLAR